jgi:uncharacterized protein YcsI (UPF0317 family)
MSAAAIVHGLTGGELEVPLVIESPIHPIVYGAFGGASVTAMRIADALTAESILMVAEALTAVFATLVAVGVSTTIPVKPVLELEAVPTI